MPTARSAHESWPIGDLPVSVPYVVSGKARPNAAPAPRRMRPRCYNYLNHAHAPNQSCGPANRPSPSVVRLLLPCLLLLCLLLLCYRCCCWCYDTARCFCVPPRALLWANSSCYSRTMHCATTTSSCLYCEHTRYNALYSRAHIMHVYAWHVLYQTAEVRARGTKREKAFSLYSFRSLTLRSLTLRFLSVLGAHHRCSVPPSLSLPPLALGLSLSGPSRGESLPSERLAD